MCLTSSFGRRLSRWKQVEGVVHAADKDSAQLRGFLELGKDIIISTIQKFSVIAEEIGKLKSKSFAVIIDEAHSSQSGESARSLRTSLSKGIEAEVTEDDLDEVSDIDARIIEEMEQRRMQDHISYFGFSGTPKNKTLELFGRKDEEGKICSLPRLFDAPEYQRRFHTGCATELHYL